MHGNFLYFFTNFKSSSSTTSRELRLVVDEDDNGNLVSYHIHVVFLHFFLRFNIVLAITNNSFLYASCESMTLHACMPVFMK